MLITVVNCDADLTTIVVAIGPEEFPFLTLKLLGGGGGLGLLNFMSTRLLKCLA